MNSAVFPYYLIIIPNSYLVFGSCSAASLMSLPMINPHIVMNPLIEELTQGEEN